MTILYKPPNTAFMPNLQEAINAQKQTIVVEIEIYDYKGGDIYGYSWRITSGPFAEHSQNTWCSVIYDTYNEALTSAWRHVTDLQDERPYWFGDAVILGMPPDTTFTICDNPKTYRPFQTLQEMDEGGIEDMIKSQEYKLNVSPDNYERF